MFKASNFTQPEALEPFLFHFCHSTAALITSLSHLLIDFFLVRLQTDFIFLLYDIFVNETPPWKVAQMIQSEKK